MSARTPDAVKRPAGPTPVPPKAAAGSKPPGVESLVGSGGRNGDVQAHHAALLADPRLDNRAGDGQRIRLLQALQRTYGNAHVAGVIAQLRAVEAAKRNGNGKSSPTLSVQLQGAVACPAPPKEPVATPPHQDPNFRSVGGEAKKGATALKRHDPAQKKVTEAQDAAKAPPDDIESQSKAAKTDTMSAAKPGTFDKAAFMAAVRTAIEAKAPKNLDEADKFASSGNADVKGEVTGKVAQGKEGATKDVKAKTEAPPDPSKAKPKDVKPAVEEKPGPRPPDPAGARAMPSPAPAEEKNLGAGTCEVDSQMKEADVTEEQLAKSNEPTFTGALKDKKEAERHADTAPAKVEHKEKAVLEGAKKGATADAQGSMTAMYGAKKGATEKLGAGKTKAQAKDEAERAKVSGEIKAIYDRTEGDVKGILDGLDKKVDTAFDRGEADAKSAFTQRHESEMKAYKDKRYSGANFWKWGKDKLLGLPEEANQIYIRARDTVYLPKMDKVISEVADIVGGELTRAKQRIEQGRAEIKKHVAGLSPNLKKYGAEAQKEFSSKFDELEQSVDDKQSEMVDKLATKYVEARDKVDEEIKKMQEANKGLIAKVADAIGGVIKTIIELKNLLMGVLSRVAGVIGKIIKDPIGFLGNLISGVKGGLQAFLGNVAEHLKKGVVGWLLGNMRGAGLELPAKFDLKGIIGMLASLLGLTWAAIRGRVLQRGVPEQAMVAAEKAVPEAETLKNEGVAGLWQKIAARIGDIKEMILTKLREYLVPTIIMAGITWIISLLNPASAFVKAVKAIIDIVRFIFERAAQLFEFINAVLDAIVTIAGGAIGGAVKAIEGALAKSIPVLIGFLAALLGIGGLANKVKSIFQALSKPVMKVIDKIVDFIVKTGKKLWAKMRGKGKKGKPGERDDRSAIAQADRLLLSKRRKVHIERRLPVIGRRYNTSLRLITEKVDVDGEIVHVQTMTGPSRHLPSDPTAELDAMFKTLTDSAAIDQFNYMKGQMKPAQMVKNLRGPFAAKGLQDILINAHRRQTGPKKTGPAPTLDQQRQINAWLTEAAKLEREINGFESKHPGLPGIVGLRKILREVRAALNKMLADAGRFNTKTAERLETMRAEIRLARRTPKLQAVGKPVRDVSGSIKSEIDVISLIKDGVQWKDSKLLASVATMADVEGVWLQAKDQLEIARNPAYHSGGKLPRIVFFFWSGIMKDAAREIEGRRTVDGGRIYVRGKRY